MSQRRTEKLIGMLGILAVAFAVNAEELPTLATTRPAPSSRPAETQLLSERLVLAVSPGDPSQVAYLGATTSTPPAALQKHLQLKAGVGLVVDAITPGGPAEKAGVKQYDVLYKLDDQLLINAEQLNVLVRTLGPGHDAKFVVIREGQPTTLTATLAARTIDPTRLSALPGNENASPLVYYSGPARRRTPGTSFSDQDVITLKDPNSNTQVTAAQIIIQDGQLKSTIDTRNRQRHLKVEDKAGKVLFEGPIHTKAQCDQVPAEYRRVIDEFLPSNVAAAAVAAPQTRPAQADPLSAPPKTK